jgi:5'-nucleotidase
MTRPLILVSNDDGVDAPGNVALREGLLRIADVITVAPRYEQSAKSHAISLHTTLRHLRIADNVHAIEGTPADCVYVALYRPDFLPRWPDLVVSGINHGANLGADVHYSGTVAAARESALRGIPSIAFSLLPRGDMAQAADLAVDIAARLLESPKPVDHAVLLNVNFPAGSAKGIRSTILGSRIYSEGVDVREDPRGREYYWIGGGGGVTHPTVAGSDTEAVDAGFVSVTPLSLHHTHVGHMGVANFVSQRRE